MALENSIKLLNEKLASAVDDCAVKDELVAKHVKMTQEAISGYDKREHS